MTKISNEHIKKLYDKIYDGVIKAASIAWYETQTINPGMNLEPNDESELTETQQKFQNFIKGNGELKNRLIKYLRQLQIKNEEVKKAWADVTNSNNETDRERKTEYAKKLSEEYSRFYIEIQSRFFSEIMAEILATEISEAIKEFSENAIYDVTDGFNVTGVTIEPTPVPVLAKVKSRD